MSIKKAKILAVYDFDGTLAFSPTPETGMHLWKSVTGFEYPFKTQDDLENKPKFDGWWGRLESLDPDVFDVQLNPKVAKAIKEDILNDDVYVVLLTGRRKKFTKIVKDILVKNDINNLDEYLFNYKGGTMEFKIGELERLKSKMKSLEHVIMWEDRMDHIPHFKKWGKDNMGDEFTLHIIK